MLFALVQVPWAGYQLGVGNQAIQIPFVERLHDPALFARDEMVNRTLRQYPSFFYRGVAWALPLRPLPELYLALQLITVTGVFVAVAALCRSLFANWWVGLVTILLMLAGHQHALAEEVLYSPGFTHTWVALPLALAALALLYGGWLFSAFALAGLLFNLHALEAGYLACAMGFWALSSIRQLGWRKVSALGLVFLLCASPTLIFLACHPQHFDAQWFQLTRIRSAYHSFPGSWWRPGQTDLPRFALVMALATLSFSMGTPGTHVRKTVLLTLGIGCLFLIGTVFTEVWPNATVVRAQLFRSSRLLLVLALAYIAAGCVRGWRLLFEKDRPVAGWQAGLEFGSATLTAMCLALPAWRVLWPVALVVATVAALLNGRLHWHQALVAAGAALVCLVAWRDIQFAVPGLSADFSWRVLLAGPWPGPLGWIMLAAGSGLWYRAQRPANHGLLFGSALGVAVLAVMVYGRLRELPGSDADWMAVQLWARANTPTTALFLTPTQPGGFRTLSQRSVVGEWRDGTQLYFSANFAGPWWQRMEDLQPGMRIAPEGDQLLVQGRPLSQLSNEQLIDLSRKYQADFIVVASTPPRKLMSLYANPQWAVYRPELAPPPPLPKGDPLAAQRKFIEEVAQPNILRNRQSDLRVQVLDAQGRPLVDATYTITETRSAVGFGVSLPVAPTARQLALVADVFDFSVLTEPAWWMNVESVEGQSHYEDLDRTLAWCAEHDWRTEFSFLTGFPPGWLVEKPWKDQQPLIVKHVDDLVGRYTNGVTCWQVMDQGLFENQAVELIKHLREKYPDRKLGISAAARFYSTLDSPAREKQLCQGLEEVRRLKAKGAPVDFVAVHGHQPWGVWPDAKTVYEVLDAFAAEGVRVHVTEFGAPSAGVVEGPFALGEWTVERQAEWCRMFYTIAYSHPAVDVINYAMLGPVTRVPEVGLLAANDEPKPAFTGLSKLITHDWRTQQTGTFPLDGVVKLRVFQGAYRLTIKPPSGQSVEVEFTVAPGEENNYRFQLGADGKLAKVTK